ncbi:hypothetical protein F4604DRAFT_1693135 [Suillus subluteus]|nr:hypothetical protein F4604DRAFT_1693135 [Suillus subluteus]
MVATNNGTAADLEDAAAATPQADEVGAVVISSSGEVLQEAADDLSSTRGRSKKSKRGRKNLTVILGHAQCWILIGGRCFNDVNVCGDPESGGKTLRFIVALLIIDPSIVGGPGIYVILVQCPSSAAAESAGVQSIAIT